MTRAPSRARLMTLTGLALVVAVIASVWGAGGPSDASPPSTTVPTGEPAYPPTSTNVLVTSPPPTAAPATTVVAAPTGRQWPVAIPEGCAEPGLPDIVFVGTVQQKDFRTARYRIDQLRAGSVEGIASNGLIDIRYDIDAKFLDEGRQYLVGASVDPGVGVLVSKVAASAPLFGGDQVIGRSESEHDCPELPDPIRTLLTNGRPIDSGVLEPLDGARDDVARSLLIPAILAAALILGAVSLRWFITGLGWSISQGFQRRRSRPGSGR